MWVSIVQNRRKKEKDNSVDKIKQYLKLTQKSSFSTSMNKSTLQGSPLLNKKSDTKQNQSIAPLSSASSTKLKGTFSTGNLLRNRNPLYASQINAISQVDVGKRAGTKIIKEHYSSTFKIKKESEKDISSDKIKGYFLEYLSKKSKFKSELTINIHNSIYTFREFMKSANAAVPKQVDPRITPEKSGRKTIVFDMDETLIHTNETMTKNYEIKVPFRSFQGRVGYGFVEVRPYAKQILKRLHEHFDVFIFTASTQAYADPIIDHLDPDRIIQHRLYRESCSLVKNQVFVKDLRVLGRKLENVILVDNAPYSYMMQLGNGVPIIPYYRGKDDFELLALEDYLMRLKDIDDVRKVNSQYFKLHEYSKFDSHEKLVSKLYGEWLK